MHSTLRLTGGILEWLARPGASPERRRLTDGDQHLFLDWAERYRRVLKRLSAQGDLSVLGREMYDWLDGGPPGWAGRVRPD
jgi:hypothetical protein